MSAAARLQIAHGVVDQVLTLQASLRHPRVRHWWGRRHRPGWHGALCYICDEPIATWSSRWPITRRALAAIELHRQRHIREVLDGPAHCEETSTA